MCQKGTTRRSGCPHRRSHLPDLGFPAGKTRRLVGARCPPGVGLAHGRAQAPGRHDCSLCHPQLQHFVDFMKIPRPFLGAAMMSYDNRWLKMTGVYWPTALEATGPKPRCGQNCASFQGAGGPSCLFLASGGASSPRQSPLPLHVAASHLPLLVRTAVVDVGPAQSRTTSLELDYSCEVTISK